MKKRLWFSVFIIMVLVMTSLLTIPVCASGTTIADTNDIDLAKQSALSFVNHVAMTVPELSSWGNACLPNPQLYYDLDGEVIVYMFAIQSNNRVVGHALVGNKSYGFPVFEAGEAAPPAIPIQLEVKTALEESLKLSVDVMDIGNPIRLLYLGVDGQYALYSIKGDLIGVNLVHGDALKFSEMKSFLPSPDEYKANQLETNEFNTVSRLDAGTRSSSINFLVMGYYKNGDRKWCGPCSGVSIGHYYKWYSETGQDYPNLYNDNDMYDSLYYWMDAWPWVFPENYGNWKYMAQECGYYNFASNWYPQVGSWHYFNRVVPDIDSGWPHALCCYPQNAHWRAIKGYDYTSQHKIICTNSATKDSWEYLDWDCLPSSLHDLVRIRDNG